MQYELTTLTHKDYDGAIEHISNLITNTGLEISEAVVDDGVKRLAYNIGDEEYAHYLFFPTLSGTKEQMKELSKALEYDAEIMRYLLITKSERRTQ